jgi:hypothetical protein
MAQQEGRGLTCRTAEWHDVNLPDVIPDALGTGHGCRRDGSSCQLRRRLVSATSLTPIINSDDWHGELDHSAWGIVVIRVSSISDGCELRENDIVRRGTRLALLSGPLSAHDADHASDWIGDRNTGEKVRSPTLSYLF